MSQLQPRAGLAHQSVGNSLVEGIGDPADGAIEQAGQLHGGQVAQGAQSDDLAGGGRQDAHAPIDVHIQIGALRHRAGLEV